MFIQTQILTCIHPFHLTRNTHPSNGVDAVDAVDLWTDRRPPAPCTLHPAPLHPAPLPLLHPRNFEMLRHVFLFIALSGVLF